MNISRREFLQMLAVAGSAGLALPVRGSGDAHGSSGHSHEIDPYYDLAPFGTMTLMHFTDSHAQLLPLYFREPNINIGVGESIGRPPHVVGDAFLKRFGVKPGSREAYAFTYLNFETAARNYGKVGGFAHLASLIHHLRDKRPNRCLLLDGGDTWQGSATALWTQAQDMVDAQKLLGVDMMVGHWEFTFGAERVKQIIGNDFKGRIEFLAQNVNELNFGDLIFKPYSLRELNGVSVGVIGQAFPYTPIANPRHLIPDWTFGINDDHMQKMVNEVRSKGAQVVVVLSHNGADVDIKMAQRVSGIDVILGGHTHDAVPAPYVVKHGDAKTLVINSGSNAKFLSVLDLDVKHGRVADFRYRLLPVFSNLIPADPAMSKLIEKVRAPYKDKLEQKLAVTESVLYRRGNFTGTFDQIILDALMESMDAEIAFSPGFRWGTTLLPGDSITLGHVVDLTAITYPSVTISILTGAEIKHILEDIADNLFNPDPYYQMGGDMARVGGLKYAINPTASIGKRISDLELRGKPLNLKKTYRVAGWASVREQADGPPVWDLVAEHLRRKKVIRTVTTNAPRIKGINNNPGYFAL